MTLPALLRRTLPALGLVLASCAAATRNVQDPTLDIRTSGGNELGVSTPYGVLFLGHTARSGEIEVTAWFGDGPTIEPSVIEPLGGGLYTAQTEILLPTTRMTFRAPRPGDKVTLIGRRGREPWSAEATVRYDPRVEGILLSVPSEVRSDDQTGAGVYVGPEDDRRLVGLVSGRLRLDTADGRSRDFLTVVGPDDTWRLVVHNRSIQRKPRTVYRYDVR